jgi:hypothetical protein
MKIVHATQRALREKVLLPAALNGQDDLLTAPSLFLRQAKVSFVLAAPTGVRPRMTERWRRSDDDPPATGPQSSEGLAFQKRRQSTAVDFVIMTKRRWWIWC